MRPLLFQPLFLNRTLSLALGLTLLLQWMPSAAEAATGSLGYGQQLLNKGQASQAIPQFEKYTRQYPTQSAGYYWLGKAYKRQGGSSSNQKAIAAFETALGINAGDVQSQRELAELYSWYSGSRNQAISLYKSYIAKAPSDAKAKKELAQLYIWTARYSEAAPLVAQVQQQFMNDKAFASALAQYHTYAGDVATAIDLYEGSLSSSDAASVLGDRPNYVSALIRSGDYAKAKGVYEELLSAAGGGASAGGLDSSALNSLSGMAYELGDYNQSIQFDVVLMRRNNVDAAQVGLRLARSYAKMQQFPQAVALISELNSQGALSADEKVSAADILADAAGSGVRLEDPALVERLYKEAIAAGKNSSSVQLGLARYYGKQPGRFNEALDLFLYGMEHSGSGDSFSELVGFLQTAYKQPGANWQGGFAKALQVFPNNATLLAGYAETLSWNELTRVESLRQYVVLGQTHPELAVELAPKVSKALGWEAPRLAKVALYQQLGMLYPTATAAKLAEARAYWQDPLSSPDDKRRAVYLYNALNASMGSDPAFSVEYAQLLASSPDKNLKKMGAGLMQDMFHANAENPEVALSYAKALASSGRHKEAVRLYDQVLHDYPDSRNALLGRGYALLWGNRPLEAKDTLQVARDHFPHDIEVVKALAEAYKALGRNDKVLELYDEVRLFGGAVPFKSALPSDLHFANTVIEANASIAPSTSELDEFDRLMQNVQTQQAQSGQRMEQLETKVGVLQDLNDHSTTFASTATPSSTAASSTLESYAMGVDEGEGAPTLHDRLDNLDKLANLTNDTAYDMRPSFRSGFLWTTQDGEKGLNKYNHWAVPNQLSFMLTPNMRVRGGYTLRNIYLPTNDVAPRSTSAHQYGMGTTWVLSDRVLFDGDVSLTNYSQTSSTNVDYQTRLQFRPTDRVKWQVGMKRTPNENSYLSFAGITPTATSEVVGQVRENAAFTELNLTPWDNWDLNAGYEFGWINNDNYVEKNTKHQVFASLGRTWQYHENHSLRAAYEFLYFGYDKDASFNYVNVRNYGSPYNVQNLFPAVVAAPTGSVLGGYFSPSSFFLNDLRLEMRGSFHNKFLEYKVGGSVGVQSQRHNQLANWNNHSGVAWTANAQLTANLTDWLALYGTAEYLDTGGVFARTRIGGGVIIRPDIPALQPAIGKRSCSP